jgi:phenylacetic acid degradation operon negative regulatory protein
MSSVASDDGSFFPLDHLDVVDIAPPRVQSGPQPQRIILSLLGDYWTGADESIPSATLVRLTAEFGITESSARVALSRLARRGFLTVSKSGRNTSYSLTPRAERFLADGVHGIMSFGLPRLKWDGLWWCVGFSVPEGDRRLRHVLRSRLRWVGFAPLYDGLWVCARDRGAHALQVLDELGIQTATVFSAEVLPGSPAGGAPQLAWDLDDARAEYQLFIKRHTPVVKRLRAGRVVPTEALVERFSALDDWLAISLSDPELPDVLLPPKWPRDEARAVMVEVYDQLGKLAAQRVREVLAETVPHLTGYVRSFASSEVTSRHRRS